MIGSAKYERAPTGAWVDLVTFNWPASMIRLVIAFLENWSNTNFDIKSAYLQAMDGHGKGTSIAISHPKEFKTYNESGEELLSKLLQNLYGHPAATSAWQKTLYAWIKERIIWTDRLYGRNPDHMYFLGVIFFIDTTGVQ